MQPTHFFRTAVLFQCGLLLVAIALSWPMDPRPQQSIAWTPTALGQGIAATIPMLVVLGLSRRFAYGPFARLKQVVDEQLRPLFAELTLAELAMVSLLAGLGEELLFRGVVQQAVTGWWGDLAGMLVANVTFGLLHALTATYALLAAVLGFYMSWLLEATGNLLVPILVHALYDFVALVWIGRVGSRR